MTRLLGRRGVAVVLAAAMLTQTTAAGQPRRSAGKPTDEDVARSAQAFVRQLLNPGSNLREAEAERKRAADEILTFYGIDRLSAAQMLRLSEASVLSYSSRKGEVIERLEHLAKDNGADGSIASAALIGKRPLEARRGPESVRDVLAAMEHPGFRDAMGTAAAHDIVNRLRGVLRERPDAAGLLAAHLAGMFRADLPLSVMGSMTIFVDALERSDATAESLESVRAAMLGAIKRWRGLLDDERALAAYWVSLGNSRSRFDAQQRQDMRARIAGQLDQHARRLEGSFGGRIVGAPAPELEVRWVTEREGNADIATLRGKVVVLVHWYRWPAGKASAELCKELAARYAGKPVEVVALTWFLQGALHGDGRILDPGGTPDQQIATIQQQAAGQGVSVPVGIADQHRLSNLYGLSWGGSVAVIDAGGIVRGVGMQEAERQAIFELIDSLLKAMPAAPPEPAAAPAPTGPAAPAGPR